MNKTDSIYSTYFQLEQDPRTQSWLLAGSQIPMLVIMASYLIFVTKVGPMLMKKRQPFVLKEFMYCYNIFQIVTCIALILCSIKPMLRYNPKCAELLFTQDYIANAWLSYAYYWLKYVDLLDTIIFVLRKKDKQITFLHTFHHTWVVFISYLNVKYMSGTHIPILCILNCGTHTIMYYYYLIAAEAKHPIWWKKYLTAIQLTQLTIIVTLTSITYANPSCVVPRKITALTIIVPVALLIGEFSRFYINSYFNKDKGKSVGAKAEMAKTR